MSLPKIASRDEWLAARKDLLAKEKAMTRRATSSAPSAANLPMVEIDKDYVFDGPDGKVRLIDMFDGRSQLIIYHFMFDPEWEDGCPSCTAGTAGAFGRLLRPSAHARHELRDGLARAAREAGAVEGEAGLGHPLVLVERHRLQLRLRRHRRPVGQPGVQLPHRSRGRSARRGPVRRHESFEAPGRSCFLQIDGRVFHTYSQYARGLESTGGSYYFLDLTALGRQEEWEEPKGRSDSVRKAQPDFAT